MEITTNPTTAAALRVGVPARASVMRDRWLVPTCSGTHNSITTSFIAAKQAAPPRGVPR